MKGHAIDHYTGLMQAFPSPDFTLMNQGYVSKREDFSWCKAEDWNQRFFLGLVRACLGPVSPDGLRVLDVGCGRGGTCSYLKRYFRPKQVRGVDLCRDNILFCRRYHRLPGLEFVEGDAEQLPFPDESFDLVVNIESSHCYPDLPRFFSEVSRVLAPGGRFCYSDMIHHDLEETRRELLRASELTLVKERDITKGVARAIGQYEPGYRQVMSKWIHPLAQGSDLIDRMQHYLRYCYHAYDSRFHLYKVWRLKKR